ncbi:MAG: LysR family transcriptional regulator [Oscillospiraceae bacterium]|nr:LysR family transcriptional regulator [Oscillospiraceae bacterium]MDD7429531.1 LysR family transcriptional regulator [Oscillospiraceae bacterium]MDY2847825.1 LysR family transcriptional regulator [Oscillospiraceae bacterium]
MNLQHLKYMVEVERVGSITKAASNLFMGQPNLSKAIKEVENEVGITIFNRTAKGVFPTEKGAEFLEYARAILIQLEKIEGLYKPEATNCISFGISVPRASYIAHAFTDFVKKLDPSKNLDINFKETNSVEAIENVADSTHNMAIIRYDTAYEEYFLSMLSEKAMKHELILKFEYRLLMSKDSPLAQYDEVPYEYLSGMTEIIHGDLSVPYLSDSYTRRNEEERSARRIYVYERGSQFDLLKGVPTTFMWVSPMPKEILESSGLVQRRCKGMSKKHKDLLVYHSFYRLTEADNRFLDELYRVRDKIAMS